MNAKHEARLRWILANLTRAELDEAEQLVRREIRLSDTAIRGGFEDAKK